MSIANKQIVPGNNELLEVPADTTYGITTIMVCNTYDPAGISPENETSTFDLHFVPSGSAQSDSVTVVVRKLSLPAGETFTFDTEKVSLDAGDRVIVVGDSTENLAATISYLEM